jgi:hypothetical protein
MSNLFNFIEFEKTEIPEKEKYELQVFSVYRSISDFIKKDEETFDVKDEIYYYRRWVSLKNNAIKQSRLTWLVNNIKRISELIRNGEFDKNDLTLAFLFISYYKDSIDLNKIKTKFVIDVVGKFSKETYEKNKQFVLDICKEIKIKSIEDFFKIGEDGTNLLYKYCIESDFISPIFYINLVEKISTQNIQNANKKYKKFEKISLIIKNKLTNKN